MCGIVGFVQKKQGTIKNVNNVVKTMTDAVHHRGPDEEAFYINEKCSLGMRRLSILDLTQGLYPFTNSNGNLHIIFNGEIYNYVSLKSELETLGHVFSTNCDGEVILKGYEQWGDNIFQRLRGMFTIAIYNDATHTLTLARDRLGIKPLYYVDSSEYFLFASEAKAFYSLRKNSDINISFSLDKELLHILSGFMFLPESGTTVVSNIKKLEPGHILTVCEHTSGQFEIQNKPYWQLHENDKYKNISYEDAVSLVDEKLTEAVKMHLLADVPLGVMLSGGVDSALITALITKKLGIPANTYTAKFHHKFNESALAEATATHLGTNHTEILVDTNDINQNIEKYVGIFDDLTTFDGGTITTSALCAQIRTKGIKVLLLGEGADEVFGGYSWFGLSQSPFGNLPGWARESLYYYAISRNITYKFSEFAKYWRSKTVSTSNTFNDISYKEIVTQLPNHLLMKVDKGSMSHSIESRVPFLDHELVELVYSLPAKFKIAGTFYNPSKSNEKRLLRDIAAKYLPKEVAYRKKKGFLLPMNDVLSANNENVKARILDSNSVSRTIFTDRFLTELFIDSPLKVLNMQKEYFKWRLFIIEAWSSFYDIR